jgi:hypothetical protein
VADHPANANPVLVGAVGATTLPSVVNDPSDTDVPPFALKVTVYVLAVHCACNVNPEVNVTDSPSSYSTDPPELVAHPAKV